jgi:hypothetical protein
MGQTTTAPCVLTSALEERQCVTQRPARLTYVLPPTMMRFADSASTFGGTTSTGRLARSTAAPPVQRSVRILALTADNEEVSGPRL